MTPCIPQLRFSFYGKRPIRCDFSGGQITSDCRSAPLRAFDQRQHLTRDLPNCSAIRETGIASVTTRYSCCGNRIYQIVAGYDESNDTDRLRHDPLRQILADQKLGDPLGSQPTFSRWENRLSAAIWCGWTTPCWRIFIRVCGEQVRQRGEILLDIDSMLARLVPRLQAAFPGVQIKQSSCAATPVSCCRC